MRRNTTRRAAPFALSTLVTVLVALVAFVVIGASTAAPAGAAKYDFYAGQTTDVGDIFVWNNATTLFVEIDLASGWCMTESHVHAASTLAGIPQTKTGNPIPGKFAYGDTYSPCDDGDTFSMPLAGLAAPKIAVHAAVWGGLTTVDAASDTTVDTVSGPLTAYFAPANAAWPAPVAAVEPTFASAGVWPTVTGAKWISTAAATEATDGTWADTAGDWIHYEAYGLARQAKFSFDGNGGTFLYDDANGSDYGVTLTDGFFSGNTGYACGTVDSGNFIGQKLLLKVTDDAIDLVWGSFVGGDPCLNLGTVTPGDGPFSVTSGNIRFGYDSWRWHRTVLTIPGGTLPTTGSVTAATSDNAERVWHNTSVIGNDGEVEGAFVDNAEWGTVNAYPFTPVIGANTLDFVWRNYGVPGLPNASNPNGLIYKAQVSYYTRSESAWAGTGVGTIQFPGANWATYIEYTVRDYVEEVSAMLYNVTANKPAFDCVTGVTDKTVPTASSVKWQKLTNGNVRVTITLTGALASSTFDAWVEQNPGTCPPGTSTPSNDGVITTNASGNGTATFTFTPAAGAVNFWLSLWTPSGPAYPGTGTQVLRSPAVAFS